MNTRGKTTDNHPLLATRGAWGAAARLAAMLLAISATSAVMAEEETLHSPNSEPQPVRRFARPSAKPAEETISGPALTAANSDAADSDTAEQNGQTRTLEWRAPRRAAEPAYRLTANSTRRATQNGGWAAKQAQATEEAGGDPFSDPFGDGGAVRRQFARPSSAQEQQPPSSSPSDLPLTPGGPRALTLEEELAQNKTTPLPPCPSPNDLKPIDEIVNSIRAQQGQFPPECTLGDPQYQPRQFCATTYTWKATGLCHKPLYFEEMALERYGHTWGPFVQPVVSAAHFWGSVLVLPYEMGTHPPQECIYDLGYYRYGSCAPQMLYTPPFSPRGAIAEGLIWTGGVFLIP